MFDLPLFPLNTVLFPGMQLKLHIFEERYKLMIRRCIHDERPFGVILIRSGREALGPAAITHDVGCTAKIIEAQKLPFDRMNIVAVGQRRFRVRGLDHSKPYLVGDVEYFVPREDDKATMRQCGRRLRPLIIRYLEILASAEKVDFDPEQIPHSPKSLAQIAAILLQADNAQKQELLRQDTMAQLLNLLVEIYRLETMLLGMRLNPPDDDFNIGPFSSN
ncbi:MAG: LON peptidase substrate-binding domain-containing protein [Chloroflexota bacterium]|nr:LON peptidase substrate-binding domain-containing protein [Chloroflexota bacterium]